MWGMYSTTPGVWGGTAYTNPATNNASCPTGFNPILAWGTDNVDWLLKWCYRDPAATTTTTTTTTAST